METSETSRPDDDSAAKFATLGVVDELAGIQARARLLELALLGGGGGMSLEQHPYLDALVQGVQDVAEGLDKLAERLGRDSRFSTRPEPGRARQDT